MLSKELAKEKRRMEGYLKMARITTKKDVVGSLKITEDKNSIREYFCQIDDKHVVPIPKDKINIVKALAQNSYNREIINDTERKINLINSFCSAYNFDSVKNLYRTLGKERKQYVQPIALSDEEFARKWLLVSYPNDYRNPKEKGFVTNSGQIVKSKADVLIANELFKKGIPFRYHYPWTENETITLYPDFTVLNVKDRTEFIFEHFAHLENENYRSKALNRLSFYASYGWFIGKNLLVSYDDSQHPLTKLFIDQIIDAFLKQ